jgi:hypothetical protein
MKKIFFFASLKSMKKEVGSGVGSGSNSQRYGSGSAPKCHGSPTLKKHKQYTKTLDKNNNKTKATLASFLGCLVWQTALQIRD